jgi:hypothetical protein
MKSKQFTRQARAGIKGEALFESTISDYSIPHHISGSKDIGLDYICEWVHGNNPSGILFSVQVKTITYKSTQAKLDTSALRGNRLEKYQIASSKLKIDDRTLKYLKGLGIPSYLFVIARIDNEVLHLFYKRLTPVITNDADQSKLPYFKVNSGNKFLAYGKQDPNAYGFARDLYIDSIRCAYSKGTIVFMDQSTFGLEQFEAGDKVFIDLLKDYKEEVCRTYSKTKNLLEGFCRD